ncbi:MAG: hypothetical protein KatS3mg010_0008 [Acidimicrobiia bacterium]|nr:MAG: hypothetical protein KatS3mg010_0008 [Acidimicrobiia bacterium]
MDDEEQQHPEHDDERQDVEREVAPDARPVVDDVELQPGVDDPRRQLVGVLVRVPDDELRAVLQLAEEQVAAVVQLDLGDRARVERPLELRDAQLLAPAAPRA